MTLSVLWGCVIAMVLREPDMKFSLGMDIVILLFMAGIPYLIGYGIHRLGKSLGQPASDVPPPQPGEPVWSDTVAAPQRRPRQSFEPSPQAQPPRFTPTRKPVQEVEIDVEPEPTPPPVLANPVPKTETSPQKPRAGTDPTAMGVDELFDPDKES
jgi:hypothetical protein